MKRDDETWEEWGERATEWLGTFPGEENVGGATIYREFQPRTGNVLLMLVHGGHMTKTAELEMFGDYEEAKARLLGGSNG